jgi:plastocyanin
LGIKDKFINIDLYSSFETSKIRVMKKFTLALLFSLLCSGAFSTVVLIGVDGCSFNPSSITISIGDTIRWYLDANVARKTSSINIPPGAQTWDVQLDATNPTFDYIVTTAGDYYYKSKILPTCIAHFKVSEKAVVATEVNSCSYFPNPVTSKFLLIHPKECSVLEVTDINGNKIEEVELDATETNDEIDLTRLAAAVYLLNVKDLSGKIIWSGKMVKNN